MTQQNTVVATRQQPLPIQLEKFTPDEYNILYPSQTDIQLSPLQKLTVETVLINPNPANKEVFKVGARNEGGNNWVDEFALSKTALESIAYAAGIVWDPNSTRRIDDGSNPRRVAYQAVGALQKPDGQWIVVRKEKEIDLDAIKKETRAKLEKLAASGDLKVNNKPVKAGTDEGDAEIKRRLDDKMIQVEKHKVALAETGAHNRVIRSMLALKPTYTAKDLQKPFVIPHITLNTEFALADPEVKRMLILQASGSAHAIFGSPGQQEPRTMVSAMPAQIVSISDVPEDEERNREELDIHEANTRDVWTKMSAEDRTFAFNSLIKQKRPADFGDDVIAGFPALPLKDQLDGLWYLYGLPTPPPPTAGTAEPVAKPLPWGRK